MVETVLERVHEASLAEAPQDSAIVFPSETPRAVLVFLHGLTMAPASLFPFAAALSLPVVFCFPYGPVSEQGGDERSWWSVDPAKRKARLAQGPSDLFDRHPKGRSQARRHLHLALKQVRQRWPELPIYLAGYSQGGMLALDYLLLDDGPKPEALILLSSTCIALDEWKARLGSGASSLNKLPVLVMHGEHDTDLALSAGERVRDCLLAARADVQWKVFNGGHELAPAVWRGLRRFVLDRIALQP
ncbi:MAG: alpha/beta hydrolase [Proteobacteria bacterium]|nr:alpha/beta hydrolase [Pseudomonadota bacterium]